jgi:hypothetical protein
MSAYVAYAHANADGRRAVGKKHLGASIGQSEPRRTGM